MNQSLILASSSRFRLQMLQNAGVDVSAEAAKVDETTVKNAMAAEGLGVEAVAEALAETKARRVASHHPESLVLGADQMLECDGRWYDKPQNRAEAKQHLISLSGQTHRLISAAVMVLDDNRIWHSIQQARLTMRPLSESYIDDYLDQMGETVLQTVGGYQLEGLGAQLFSRIDGDFFTILGLPLLPVLDFLRLRGVLKS